MHRRTLLKATLAGGGLTLPGLLQVRADGDTNRFVDLSPLVAPEYPCTWPSFPAFQIKHYQKIGPRSAYNSDIPVMDGNTGTQLDVPTHSVTRPDSGFPNAGKFGNVTTDKVPAWQFVGEACVVDCTDLLDSAPKGRSDLIKKDRVARWEKDHRPLAVGDVVLFHSGSATNTTSRCQKDGDSPRMSSRGRHPRGRGQTRIARSTSRAAK